MISANKLSLKLFALILLTSINTTLFSQSVISLYKDSIPNSRPPAPDEEKSEISKDSILIVSKELANA